MEKTYQKTQPRWIFPVVVVLLFLFGFGLYCSLPFRRWSALAAALAAIYMLLRWRLRPLWTPGAFCLLGYLAFCILSAWWAMAGKFCLRDTMKLVVSGTVFLFVALWPRFDRAFARRVLLAIAAVAALCAVLSVELASTGVTLRLLDRLGMTAEMTYGFQGVRLYGIFGNSNIEAGIYGLGIFSALAALSGASGRGERVSAAALAALNAFGFLLCVSLGAMASFALGVVVYLIAAGKTRVRELLRMLAVALPALLLGVLAAGCFNSTSALWLLPLPLMAAAAALTALLELKLSVSLSERLTRYEKLPLLFLLGIAAIGALYLAAALNLTGPYTFGENLWREAYTAPGPHTLEAQSSGEVQVSVYSANYFEILRGERGAILYRGALNGLADFTVPEDSSVVRYVFSSEPGVTIYSATLDGMKRLPLHYRLMPSFMADRLQGVWTSSSLVVRRILWVWGMRLFRLSPVVGNGVGSFESGLRRVEDTSFATRYPHNYYVQTLLEVGVIGFALYAGALLCMAVVLIKKHRAVEEDETCGWAYPALCGTFVMICVVTFWDLSMSESMFQAMCFALWALIIRQYAEPLPVREPDAQATRSKRARSASTERGKKEWAARGAAALIPALFALTLCGNLAANNLSKRPVSSLEEYFDNLERAAAIDIYERNDWKVSYVTGVITEEVEGLFDKSDAYAAELMKVQSNSLPYYLMSYYCDREQYENMIKAAKYGAIYSASDKDTWQKMIYSLWHFFVLRPETLEKRMDLLPELGSYLDMLDQRNATALEQIELPEEEQMAFDTMKEIVQAHARGDEEGALRLLRESIDQYSQWKQA